MSDDDLAPEPYTIDFVMSEDPTKLTKQDLAFIVQYHRNIRADRAAGVRKPYHLKVSTAPAPAGVKAMIKKAVPGIDRRGM